MARVIKPREHAGKRNEILDAAERLMYTKGYEQMAIQDILTALGISKGAFYHYFDSKQALMEAMIERAMDAVEQVLEPIVQDASLGALTKLQRYFDTAARWKAARKAYMLELLRVWYDDHNAIVRQKMLTASIKHLTPLLAGIIEQGVREGVFSAPYPAQAAEIVVSLFQSFGDSCLAPLLLPAAPRDATQATEDARRLESALAAYTDALERVLGAPRGSLVLADVDTLKEWMIHD
jgi:AcrR family transcriptional regulator